jgi:WD40 repeat protein
LRICLGVLLGSCLVLFISSPAAPRPATTHAKTTRTDFLGDPLPSGALARFGTVRLRHQATIATAVYSPDGKWLASAGNGQAVVHLWDAVTGKEIWHIDRGESAGALGEGVELLVYSPCGTKLAAYSRRSGCNDLVVLDVASGKQLVAFRCSEETIEALAFADGGKTIVFVYEKGAVTWIDAASGKFLRSWRPLDDFLPKGVRPRDLSLLSGVALSSDGQRLAVRGVWKRSKQRKGREELLVIDLAKRSELWRTLEASYSSAGYLFFSPDSKFLAFDAEPSFVVCDAATGKEHMRLAKDPEGMKKVIHCALFTPDSGSLAVATVEYSGVYLVGTWIYMGPMNRDVNFYTPTTGKPQRRISVISGNVFAPPHWMTFSPDARTLVVNGNDRTLTRWDIDNGKRLPGLPGHDETVHFVRFLSDGRHLDTGSQGSWCFPQNLTTWEINTGKSIRNSQALELPEITELEQWKGLGFVSPDHFLDAHYADDGSLNVHDRLTGIALHQLSPPSERRNCEQIGFFSSSGRLVAFLDNPAEDEWSLRESRTGKKVCMFRCPARSQVVLTSDEKLMAWHEYVGTVHIVEVATGNVVNHLGNPRTRQALMDSCFRAIGKQDKATLFDCAALALALTNRHAAAWDSQLQAIRVWNLATGKQIWKLATQELDGTISRQVCLAFSPDSRMLAIGGKHGTNDIELWEVSTGKLRRILTGHLAPVEALAFSDDGLLLASGSQDTTALLWEVYGGG